MTEYKQKPSLASPYRHLHDLHAQQTIDSPLTSHNAKIT